MTLFVNACVRKGSRTARLAERFLSKMNTPYEEIRPGEIGFPAADEEFIIRRDRLASEGRFDDPLFDLARQFAAADEIVFAAPFWDLSFPAALKQYLEQINAVGVTFYYTPEGVPAGLCRAKRLTYITTAGGEFAPEEFGFGYVRALARNFWGIPDVKMISASGLDIVGADTEKIMRTAYEKYGI
ncbi:MAG: NAD(P)H-dependent oxidoreductase [Clostridia bacterium]|nr:NAD(P)H-dependent oxidoreductase [Clostridia bacterium]